MSGDYASIVIIKRSGGDGPRFPLRRNECLFGRFVLIKSNILLFVAYVLIDHLSCINFDLLLSYFRDTSCDLRVQLPGVALEHAKVSRSENNDVSCWPL
jgi:hypothetical protein